jgi:prespore-specific regulator
MTAIRQDAWTENDDLLLAEVTLRCICNGSTQLAAFEEVGNKLGRTAAACGFRWNSFLRKQYETAMQLAKEQRKQRKDELTKVVLNQNVIETVLEQEQESETNERQTLGELPINNSDIEEQLSFESVIRFLRNQKKAHKQIQQLIKELEQKSEELEGLRAENEQMKKEISCIQNEYQTVEEDYKALIRIMDRARKMAFLQEEEIEKRRFRMEHNGNLEIAE